MFWPGCLLVVIQVAVVAVVQEERVAVADRSCIFVNRRKLAAVSVPTRLARGSSRSSLQRKSRRELLQVDIF